MIVVRNGSVTPSVTGWRPDDAFGVRIAAFCAATALACSCLAAVTAWVRAAGDTPLPDAIPFKVLAAPVSDGTAVFRYAPTAASKQPDRSSESSALCGFLQSTRWAWSSGLLMRSRTRSFCQ